MDLYNYDAAHMQQELHEDQLNWVARKTFKDDIQSPDLAIVPRSMWWKVFGKCTFQINIKYEYLIDLFSLPHLPISELEDTLWEDQF